MNHYFTVKMALNAATAVLIVRTIILAELILKLIFIIIKFKLFKTLLTLLLINIHIILWK